jgi:hypothetical protein
MINRVLQEQMKRVEDYEEWEKAKKGELPFIKTQVGLNTTEIK